MKVRAGDLLCRVSTHAEVLDVSAAFLQHYRETAVWNERTAPWLERLGLEAVKKVVLDPEQQKGLVERMNKALATYKDPWKDAQSKPEFWQDSLALTAGGVKA